MSEAHFTADDSRDVARDLCKQIAGGPTWDAKHTGGAIRTVARRTKMAYGTVKALWYRERAVVPWELIKNLEVCVARLEARSAQAEQNAQLARERGSDGKTAALLGMGAARDQLRKFRNR